MHQVIEDVIKDSVEFDNRIEETIEAVVKKAMLDNDDDPEWIGKQVQEMSEAIEEAVMSGLDGLDQNQAIVEKPKRRRKMKHIEAKILYLSENSHFENLNFYKIHIFKISIFTKFTLMDLYFSKIHY